jgi:hypothetical protein
MPVISVHCNKSTRLFETYVKARSTLKSTLRAQDAAQGKWLNEDPTLAQIQQILVSRH